MNKFFQQANHFGAKKDKTTLFEFLDSLSSARHKTELHFFLARLPKLPDEVWRDGEVRNRVNRIETKWKLAAETLRLLVADQPINLEQREFLMRLIRQCEPALVESRFLPNLLVTLNQRGTIEAANVLPELLTWHATNSSLATVIQVLTVCAPNAASEAQVRRCTLLRPVRIRWLAKFLLAAQRQESDGDIKLMVSGLSKVSAHIHRQIIMDLWWVSSKSNKNLAQSYVAEAVKTSDIRDCDLLVPLLAANPNGESHDLLESLAKAEFPKISKLAQLALQS